MSKKAIVAKVGFGCSGCKSNNLRGIGAVRTAENLIYFMYQCEDCGEAVPIPVDGVFASLYDSNSTKGSDKVN